MTETLLGYAQWHFNLRIPNKDGATLEDHLLQIFKHGNDTPEGLIAPEFPEQLRHVWEWFSQLQGARVNYGFGVAPITYTEMNAWCSMHRIQITPDEVDILKRVDALYLSEVRKKDKEE